jgi:putative acyl-CoA dehydrogenase
LIEQPLMQNVLADLVLEAEAATALALRLARAFEADAPAADRALARVTTPALKYWICKRATATVSEAAEVLGGNGYVEESPLPRMLREAPLNSIWEGSGNVISLDVLRAARREPAAIEALVAELASARGADAHFDRHAAALAEVLHGGDFDEGDARRIAGSIATALAASLLLRNAPQPIAEAYCRSRLDQSGPAFGTLPRGIDCAAVLAALA